MFDFIDGLASLVAFGVIVGLVLILLWVGRKVP